MKQSNTNDTTRKAFESTSLHFSNEDALNIVDKMKRLGFAPGGGCKEKGEVQFVNSVHSCLSEITPAIIFTSERNDITTRVRNGISRPKIQRPGPQLEKELKKEQIKINNIKKEIEVLKSEIEKCGIKTSDLVRMKKRMEERIEEIRNEGISSEEAQESLNQIQATCRMYKKISGIHWDYSAPENIAKGYIVGPVKNYVHAFEFPVDDDLPSKIWQEIEKSSCVYNDQKGKENISNSYVKFYNDEGL